MESRSWYTQEKEMARILGSAKDQERARQDEAARAVGNRHARRAAEAEARRAAKRAKLPA